MLDTQKENARPSGHFIILVVRRVNYLLLRADDSVNLA